MNERQALLVIELPTSLVENRLANAAMAANLMESSCS
jgi:hypothetical protein